MRICLHTIWVINQRSIGGTERFLIDLSKELLALGHEPFIVCSSPQKQSFVEGIEVIGCIPEEYQKAYCHYPSVNPDFVYKEILQGNFSVNALQKLSQYTISQLKEIKADVYHLNSFASASYIEPWAPFVVTNHENGLEYDSYWGNGFFAFMSDLIKERKALLHKHSFLVTPSKYYAKKFTELFGLEVKGINLGVCLNHFMITRTKNRQDIKGKISALLPSRFDIHQKGHDIAVRACSILKSQGINIEMIFTGLRDDYKSNLPEFNQLIREYNVEDCIKVTRYKNIQDAYVMCDVVLSPERYCSYGLSISEALSLSIPTVLSDIPTYKEIAGDFDHAYFFKSESAEDLAKMILKSSNSQTSYREEAISFRTKYDLRNCAKKYSELYSHATQNSIYACKLTA